MKRRENIWTIKGSHAALYFWTELRHKIIDIKDEASLDLVILPGIHRSGTSVMYQCVHETDGFQEKHPLTMIGIPPSEHKIWRIANTVVAKYLGATSLMPGSSWDKLIGDLIVGNVDNSKPLEDYIKEEMDNTIGIFMWQDLKVLKEPTCQLSLQKWIDFYECFRNAKYIWTRRDYREVARSLVRLKVEDRWRGGKLLPTGYRGTLTVPRAEKLSRYLDGILENIMPQVNHIEIWHHDLVNDTKNTFDRISEFIGKEVNTTPFDRGKVYAERRKAILR